MMMGIWLLLFLVLLSGILILSFWVVKNTRTVTIKENNRNKTLAILEERYVNGQITKEEFKMIKKGIY